MVNDVFQNNQGVPVIRDGDPELQAAIRNKPHEYGRVFVMVNNEYLGHVGLVIGEGDEALLYDPSGTYSGCDYNTCKSQKKGFRGSGDMFEYPYFEWDDYLSYHLEDGFDIVVFEFIVKRERLKAMYDNVDESLSPGYFGCARNVSRVLYESGGDRFKNVLIGTPWGLKERLLNLQMEKGLLPYVYITTSDISKK
ncbi:hypothetical protein ACQFZT_002702 [Providencia stuartii]|uniref:hypothetical protein n=1 Tax=Providencia stuartii TaxID=588 RepID=UPI0028C1908A|nr:hypothetical protein [Providencia stuartii]MDT7049773.1 hypothetical protein [Providencia stuartii]